MRMGMLRIAIARAVSVVGALAVFASCSSAATRVPQAGAAPRVVDTVSVSSDASLPTVVTSPAPQRCKDPVSAGSVKVWHILPDNVNAGDTFAALVEEFNASHPQLKIDAVKVGGGDDLQTRLRETPQADWPDIVIAPPSSLKRLADTGSTITPGECPSGETLASSLLPGIAAAYSIGGVLQAVPYGVSTPVLLFDATKLRAAGLDPDHPPTTPDELFAASKQIVDRGASPFGLVVYDWYAGFFVHQWAAQRGEVVAMPNNGRDGEQIRVEYDTAENRAAMQWIVDVVANGGAAWIGGVPTGLEDLGRIIAPANGAAMTIHTSGSIGDILALQGKGGLTGVELGVGPMPGPGPGGLVGGNGFWLIDHQDSQRAGAAFEFIRWLSDPAQMGRFDVATGYIPPGEAVARTPAVTAAWRVHPQLKVGYDQLHAMSATAAAAGALYGPSSEIDALFWDLTNAILDRHVSPSVALSDATRTANKVIATYDDMKQSQTPTPTP